ncbi:hypothetical protein G6F49_010948 [Rhizopus delemar]|nr:hypothetical protein G6F49_010948 [Rhizopus delemar]
MIAIGKEKHEIEYHYSTNAWMTTCVKKLNVVYGRQNRRIAFLLDNASVHKIRILLNNIKLIFLLANTTSKLQALDAGIIDNFKAYFRAQQYDRALCLYITNAWLKCPTSALPLEKEIVAELNGILPDLPGNFDNKVTDVSQLNLEADESEMIVCYTTKENDNTEQDEQRVDIVECKKRLREAYETILMYEVPLDDLDRKLHRRIRMRLADTCAELNKTKEENRCSILFYKKDILAKLSSIRTGTSTNAIVNYFYNVFAIADKGIYDMPDTTILQIITSVGDAVSIFRHEDYSESVLLHELWPFIYKIFRDRRIRGKLGERSRIAVALARNANRSLKTNKKRQRKAVGAKLDILFKIENNEFGSCEVGKDKVTIVDDKYMDDVLVKLPKTLRDMLCMHVNQNLRQINNFSTIGFLIMGLCMELLRMDIPHKSAITRVLRSSMFEFPSSPNNIGIDFIHILEITWKAKQAMLKNAQLLKDRKRKDSELLNSTADKMTVLPYSFVRFSDDNI